jgi:hypothetical protein
LRRFSSTVCPVAALAAPCVVTASMLVSIDVVLHRSRMLIKAAGPQPLTASAS